MSEFGCWSVGLLVLAVLNQGVDSARRNLVLKFERLDDFAHLGEDFGLNEAFVTLACVPLLAHRPVHHFLVLLGTGEGVRQFLDPVLVGELLVSFLSVEHHSLHFGVSPLLPQLLNFSFPLSLQFLSPSPHLLVVNALALPCPLVPASLNYSLGHFLTESLLNVLLLLLFELVDHSLFVLSYEQFLKVDRRLFSWIACSIGLLVPNQPFGLSVEQLEI
jgi:hypothetical protein